MNEKNKAIGKTFLWNIAFGFMISIILAVISIIAFSVMGSSAMLVMSVAYFASFVAYYVLTYGKCYDYGRDPCVEDCATWKKTQKGEYPKRDAAINKDSDGYY
jgi:hypothetical protein